MNGIVVSLLDLIELKGEENVVGILSRLSLISAYLIAQLANNFAVPEKWRVTGRDLSVSAQVVFPFRYAHL